ncbi:hypothetical protein FUA23_03065 [Neolewinella aurantiaca]|uniref:Uncharacterized protein n=1 Tax=Neolewinella aurantiaca TaxID=2602767 RepID=A0A5C7FMA4_9BACT|nr:hypothetical protein [Neolewinella aurantiaca]TXF91218.1 hypothetical protein FUA23_03065 [Neolewinella aurantiaca]
MLPLFEIQQLFSRLLSEANPAATLSDLDPLTLEMIRRLAKDHESQLHYFHHLKFDKEGSQSGSLWHHTTCEVCASRLLDAIHVMTYDRPTAERHLNELPAKEIALYYAYLHNAGIYHPANEFGGVLAAHKAIGEKHGKSGGTFKNAWDEVCTRGRREGANGIKGMINRIRHYLPPVAREIAEAELAQLN